MGYGWQHTRRVNDMFQRFQGPTCTSNYINTKNEIEQKINTFNYKDPNNYCRRCNEIKKNITEKTGELQYCYGITKFQRIENTHKIKEFISKCPDLPKCRYPPNKPVRKPVASKVQKTDSCPGSRNCEGKIVTPDEQKSKAAPVISARNPQAGRSEEKASLKEDKGHSDGNELRDGKVISPSRPEAIPPSDPVRTQDEGSKSTVNLPSVSTEETGTPIQYVSSPSPSASVELGTPSSAHSSQSSATRGSHSSSSMQPEDLNKGGPTTNLDGIQSEGNNQLQNIPDVAQNNQGLAHDNADAIQTSSRGEDADYGKSRIEDTSDRVTSDQTGYSVVDQGNTDSRGSQLQVANSGHHGGKDETHGINTNKSIHPTNNSDVDTTSVKVPGSELTDDGDKSGIFNQIFNTMRQNKENVIKTSIPMGIVLLLSLLFKYTPLWRILTKRNRNKRSHMNEKLQRVLQQPSIGNEERSIPFSYSAFEYSS
ncbi:unnamed protein product [Plasmodium vivax]|uniref:(malaria parasite P. vivax) hypothetical protein n=1 Tax=Plasmodium vivax TaxID=5855 RepID=A0A8S4HKT4_PLAVI|nr:unnamed protein product [Plasmodium vivax]